MQEENAAMQFNFISFLLESEQLVLNSSKVTLSFKIWHEDEDAATFGHHDIAECTIENNKHDNQVKIRSISHSIFKVTNLVSIVTPFQISIKT